MDLYLSSGYDPDDFSVTHVRGVDDGIIDVNALNFDADEKTLQGTITLKQRLDFENPTDGGENSGDNDYEVAIFRVMNATSSNDFKLIVRITNAADPQKLEILIDSFHLDDINQQRGIREVYLYEDSGAMAPMMGSDSNNFLTADLVEDTSFLGDVDTSTDLTKLYDQDDGVDAFLTATHINNNSNTYHRIFLGFTEEVNIQKVAIRGRQVGGYYGFVFILRDKNDHIISVHQASNPLSRGSGSDETATSTYDFVSDYNDSRHPISNFGITLDNMYFDIAENSTNVILIDNFFVAPGYEYERGFVNIINTGADIEKFNTNDLYFLDNELVGLSFKTAPDAEDKQDADNNNVYELGTVIITNVDGGRLTFTLPVRAVNVPATVSLTSNAVSYTLSIYTSNIIDLTEVVNPSNFDNDINLGRGTYEYELLGVDSGYFKIVGNMLKTVGDFGFISVFENGGTYNFQVRYDDEGGNSETLSVNIQISLWEGLLWEQATSFPSAPLSSLENISFSGNIRKNTQIVTLTNNDILILGGFNPFVALANDIYMKKDGENNWNLINASAPWIGRYAHQAVVLGNNDILIMGGRRESQLNDIWLSTNYGRDWTDITPAGGHWSPRLEFQAVVLTNDDILVMGGINHLGHYVNDIWLSEDGGRNWQDITPTGHWSPRKGFRAFLLFDTNLVVMGGNSIVPHLPRNDIWVSTDGGNSWQDVTPASSNHWKSRYDFKAYYVDGQLVVRDGVTASRNPDKSVSSAYVNDAWVLDLINRLYQ